MSQKFDVAFAKKCLMEFMQEHFGRLVGANLLKIKMSELKIKSIDSLSEGSFIKFIDDLFKLLFSDRQNKEEIDYMKILLIKKILGKEKALAYLSGSIYNQSVKPIDFINILYGKLKGEMILNLAKKKLGEGDIEAQDEYTQTLFMKKLFTHMYGDNPDLLNDVKVDMLNFMRHGPTKYKLLRTFKTKFGLNRQESEKYHAIRDAINSRNENELQAILENMREQSLSDILKNFNISADMEQNAISQTKLDNIIEALAGAMGKKKARQFYFSERTKLDFDKLDLASDKIRATFYNDLLKRPEMDELSPQKKSIIIDKIKSYLDL